MEEQKWLRALLAACERSIEPFGEASLDAALLEDVEALRAAIEAKLKALTSEAPG